METSLQSVAQPESEPARGRSPYKEIWGVVDRNGRGYWTRIGVAFQGKTESSWNLRFDYMPLNVEARIHMFDPKDWDSKDQGASTTQTFPDPIPSC